MKKIIIFLTLLITNFCLFAYEDVNIKNDPYFKDLEIPKGVTVINPGTEQKSLYSLTRLRVSREKKEDFLKRVRWEFNPEVLSFTETLTMESIIGALKQEKKILDTPEDAFFVKYIWYESNTDGIYSKFSQTGLWHRIHGFGSYKISIFLDDYVYTIGLYSPSIVEERTVPMDSLSEYMYFKEGYVTNYEKGIDGDQGYRWINGDESAEKYFNDLTAKKKTLPKEVIEFQTTYEELIKNIIEHFE